MAGRVGLIGQIAINHVVVVNRNEQEFAQA